MNAPLYAVLARLLHATPALAAFAVAAATPAQQAGVESIAAAVQEHLDAAREQRSFPGAGAGIVLPDGTSFGVVTGSEDPAGEQPLNTAHKFLSGSIGKTYCAAVALQLVAEEELELDGRVAAVLGKHDWFARVPNAGTVTLRQLLNHTSGIPEHVWKEEFRRRVLEHPDDAPSPAECVAFVLGDDPLFEAGTGWSYADTNFVLVGLMIEAVTGRPFYDELRRRVLDPLQLTDTVPSDRRELPGLCNGTATIAAFHRGDTLTDGRYFVNPAFEYCGGGLCSTPRDLARWGHALFGGDVVPEELRAAQRQPVECDRRVADGYGLGCFVSESPLGPALGHSGFMPGYQSVLMHYTEPGLTVAVMWNTDDGRRVGHPVRAAHALARVVAEQLQTTGR